jgi:hypothetical protein
MPVIANEHAAQASDVRTCLRWVLKFYTKYVNGPESGRLFIGRCYVEATNR